MSSSRKGLRAAGIAFLVVAVGVLASGVLRPLSQRPSVDHEHVMMTVLCMAAGGVVVGVTALVQGLLRSESAVHHAER